jgi:hypothetical protein
VRAAQVVARFVVVVAKARERTDRERRERAVDRAIDVDRREVARRRLVVLARGALGFREIEIRLGRAQCVAADFDLDALDPRFARGDGVLRGGSRCARFGRRCRHGDRLGDRFGDWRR